MTRFLTEEQLKGFERYKYNCVDTSILSNYVMHPFWNWCVKFVPIWVAPNLLTFTGFLLTVCNFLLFSYYDYGFDALGGDNPDEDAIPRWVWAISAVNLFVAYTLDGVDGKQARRTGSSGPLGELFDHGLDSYSAVLIPTCLYSIFGRNELSTLRFFFVVWNIFLNFYLPHWEKYNTGVMFLPWGYDFTMLGSCALQGWCAWWGAGRLAGQLRVLCSPARPAVVFELLLYVSAALTSHTVILYNIYRSYRAGSCKRRGWRAALRPLLPLAAFFALSGAWALGSPHDIVARQPRLFYLLTGTIFSNITCRLIVSQMSDTRCPAWNWLLLPYAAAAAAALGGAVGARGELRLLAALAALATAAHLHYGASVVKEMCEHFKIRCFHIKPKINVQ